MQFPSMESIKKVHHTILNNDVLLLAKLKVIVRYCNAFLKPQGLILKIFGRSKVSRGLVHMKSFSSI